MKQLLHFVIVILLSVSSYTTFAQADITITDHRNFVLQAIENDGTLSAGGNEILKLTAIYESSKNQYTIKEFGATAALFELKAPLNRTEFRNQLTTALNKKDQNIKAISEYSVEEVFLWVYSLKQQDGSIISGRLNLGLITKPFKDNSTSNGPERVKELEEMNNRYIRWEAISIAHKKIFIANLQSLLDSTRKTTDDNGLRDDTVLLSQILDIFKNQHLPELNDEVLGDFRAIQPIKKDPIDRSGQLTQVTNAADSLDRVVAALSHALDSVKKADSSARELKKRLTALTSPTDTNPQAANARTANQDSIINAVLHITEAEKTRLDSVYKHNMKTAKRAREVADSVKYVHAFLGNNITYLNKEDETVKKAIIKLKELYYKFDTARKELKSVQADMRLNKIFPIEKVSLQFERGHIERVQAWVRNESGALDIYENIYAIGFSSINNLKAFQSTRLFIRKSTRANFYDGIFLSDVLGNYDNMLDLFTRDYSPGDTVINEIAPATGPITLYKERNIKLFESKIYTDLQGFQEDAPNGLVQVEVNRKFNLNTFRWQVGARMDVSWVSYMNVYGAINKIENKSKELVLRNKNIVENGVIVSPSYATNLDIRQYENASLGVDLNTFLFDWPDMKFTAYLDIGARYGHLKTLDTVYKIDNGIAVKASDKPNKYSGNTFTMSLPKITFEFFSERRVGFNLSYNYNTTWLFSNNTFKQIVSYAKSDLNSVTTERNARKSHMMEVFLRAETSHDSNGQLFLRGRFFWQQGDASTFFPQVQVGYSYNIIFRK